MYLGQYGNSICAKISILITTSITHLFTRRKQFNRIHKFKMKFFKVKLNTSIEFPYLHYVHHCKFHCYKRSGFKQLMMDVNTTGDIREVNNNETEINDVRILAATYALYKIGKFFCHLQGFQ